VIKMPRYSAGIISFALALVPLQAMAQGPVEPCVGHYQQGEFQEALQCFDQAELGDNLSKEGFMRSLVYRAIVHYALGETRAVEQSLFRLATIDPEHAFGSEVPPPVREAFEQAASRVRRPLTVRVTHETTGNQVTIECSVVSDIAGLVRTSRLAARVQGSPWQEAERRLEVSFQDGETVEYYCGALGPGQAVLRSEGTAEEPLTIVNELVVGPPGGGEDEGGGAGVWIALGITAAVAIAGGTVLYFVLKPDADTNLMPQVRF